MKKLNSFLMALLMLAVFACGGNMASEQQASGENAQAGDSNIAGQAANLDMAKVIEGYMKLKNALVSSDDATAMMEASKLASKLEGHPMKKMADDVKMAASLNDRRQQFSVLSEALYTLLKEKGGNSATLYKQYCPMAFDNKGASWLSDDEAIKNPYFGDEMLTCGEVKETLASK